MLAVAKKRLASLKHTTIEAFCSSAPENKRGWFHFPVNAQGVVALLSLLFERVLFDRVLWYCLSFYLSQSLLHRPFTTAASQLFSDVTTGRLGFIHS